MKLLFDQNISFRLLPKIENVFPESEHVNDLGLNNRTDRDIWDYARIHDFAIVTFDADFYEYSVVWGHPPKIIWIRSGNQATSEIEKIIRMHSDTILHFFQDDKLACLEIINREEV